YKLLIHKIFEDIPRYTVLFITNVNSLGAIVNFTMEFINIVTGWSGSAHNSL
ncbi:hypothetical protein L9F63_018238, partial [Diploptera punctata]